MKELKTIRLERLRDNILATGKGDVITLNINLNKGKGNNGRTKNVRYGMQTEVRQPRKEGR
jgi:hypothetical protein